MSGNGNGYVSRVWRATCAALCLRHLRTRRLHAADERQSRTLHPDAPPRVGICRTLRLHRGYGGRSSVPICGITTASDRTRASLSGSVLAAHERCVMNNVLELNS